eukprot:s5381_g1.t1
MAMGSAGGDGDGGDGGRDRRPNHLDDAPDAPDENIEEEEDDEEGRYVCTTLPPKRPRTGQPWFPGHPMWTARRGEGTKVDEETGMDLKTVRHSTRSPNLSWQRIMSGGHRPRELYPSSQGGVSSGHSQVTLVGRGGGSVGDQARTIGYAQAMAKASQAVNDADVANASNEVPQNQVNEMVGLATTLVEHLIDHGLRRVVRPPAPSDDPEVVQDVGGGEEDELQEISSQETVTEVVSSICLAFSIGWLGIWNVMPSYSSYAASTIAVIVYTYTGATPSVTLRRLSGVVLGKVAGSILQLALAVKHVVYIFFFASAMYLHTSSDLAPVFGLTAAFAAASMIPSSGVLRSISDNTQASVLPTLMTLGMGQMNTVVQTVFGISLMLLVDTLLATRATKQARQRLGRAMDRLQLCLEACAGSHLRPEEVELVESSRSAFLQDLDALKERFFVAIATTDLLPHAAAEPIYWSKPFELELFTLLEACLRAVANHMGMLCWLVKFAGVSGTKGSNVDRN